MKQVYQDEDGVLVWNEIKSVSKLKDCLNEYASSHNLSLDHLNILKIIKSDLSILTKDTFTELQVLSKLTIKSCKWKELPAAFQLPPTLTELCLEENEISELTENLFDNLPLLEVLTLQENRIEKLANGVFGSLRNLKRLILLSNDIFNHNSAAFKGFAAVDTLEEIRIESCEIKTLEVDAFQGLKKIKTININYNRELSLPPSIFSNLTSLKNIDFFTNSTNTKVIGENHFNKNYNLLRLNLSDNFIYQIHKHAFRDLKSLTELYLGLNSLATLDEMTFQEVKSLRVLDLNWNRLQKVPPISNLTNLKCLSLHKNCITNLKSEDFNGLGGLLTLNLGENHISQIEKDTFKNLSSLFNLDLRENKLQSIRPGSFGGLGQLHCLNLSDNKLIKIERGCFEGLKNLHKLDIGKNPKCVINPDAYVDLTSLTTLSLDTYTDIRNIEPNSFCLLKKLKSLDLSRNSEVDFNVLFNGLDELQSLNLYDNRLKCVHKLADEKLNKLAFLDISGCNIEEVPLDIFDRLPSLAIVKAFLNVKPEEVLIDWQHKCRGITFLQEKDRKS